MARRVGMLTRNQIGERVKRTALEFSVSASKHKLRTSFLLLVILPGFISFLIMVARTIQAGNTGFESKTLWDWMDLLLVPAALGVGIWWLNRSEKASEQKAVTSRMQEGALQSYYDAMTELLLENNTRATSTNQFNTLARSKKVLSRTRTLSVLRAVGDERKSQILLFLYEADLIRSDSQSEENSPFIDLSFADFSAVNLSDASIRSITLNLVNLRDSVFNRTIMEKANLQKADLRWAKLSKANLSLADLRNTNMANASLIGTIFSDANLRGAYLYRANMRDAVLRGADFRDATLSNTDLTGANLEDADLRRANLQSAKVTEDQLMKARKLDGATMPNGQKYEEWIREGSSRVSTMG